MAQALDGLDHSDPLLSPIQFVSLDDEGNVLRYLQFSDPDYPGDPLFASSMPRFNNENVVMDFENVLRDFEAEQVVDVGHEEGNAEAHTLNASEIESLFPTWSPPIAQLDCTSHASETAAVVQTNSSVPVAQLDCSRCDLLRVVVHSNGSQNMKLEIHGGPGIFYHAMLDVNYNVDGFPPAMEQSYFDLSMQSFESVKQFLTEYSMLRVRDQYAVIQDSLSGFYDALTTIMNHEVSTTNTGEQRLSEHLGLHQSMPMVADSSPTRPLKTGIAAQRERTGKLHLRDLADYFHLPIADASREMGICSTALKKICRKHGLHRWPHRKVKSIDRKISKLKGELLSRGGEDAVRTQAEIEKLKMQRSRICGGLPPSTN